MFMKTIFLLNVSAYDIKVNFGRVFSFGTFILVHPPWVGSEPIDKHTFSSSPPVPAFLAWRLLQQ